MHARSRIQWRHTGAVCLTPDARDRFTATNSDSVPEKRMWSGLRLGPRWGCHHYILSVTILMSEEDASNEPPHSRVHHNALADALRSTPLLRITAYCTFSDGAQSVGPNNGTEALRG